MRELGCWPGWVWSWGRWAALGRGLGGLEVVRWMVGGDGCLVS